MALSDPPPLPEPMTQRVHTDIDRQRMRRAWSLACRAVGVSDPNPRVGCVIGRETVLAEGWTRQAGSHHAEADALAQARGRGIDLRGATAWVTLEPCSHTGRTPPCADALIAAGIARVVVGTLDPNPLVAGQGLQRLREAGVEVVVLVPQIWSSALEPADDWAAARHLVDAAQHAQSTEAAGMADIADVAGPEKTAATADAALLRDLLDLNIGFFSRMQRGRPWVRMKMAASLDGRTALPDGRSQWITGAAARADGHRWRQRAGAIVTGLGTVLADDPRLDVRVDGAPHAALAPMRVIVDSHWQTPPTARMLSLPGSTVVVGSQRAQAGSAARIARLQAAGAQTIALSAGTDGRPEPTALLHWLSTQGLNEVHIEAGAQLSGALLAAGIVDELLLYQAPILLGEGRPLALLPPCPSLDAVARGQWIDVRPIGPDLRLRIRWRQTPG